MSNKYAKVWDAYTVRTPNPGAEWGSPEHWDMIFRRYFGSVNTWGRAIEIGAGAGKYTSRVLEANPNVHVAALDVSAKFLEVLAGNMPKGRVSTFLLNFPHEAELGCSPMETVCRKIEWEPGTVDAVYSIDAMVHVEWQLVVSYIASAAKVLKNGGVVIMSLANCVSNAGFDHMLTRTHGMYQADTSPDGQFHYTSPEAVRKAFKYFGFTPIINDRERDIWVVAVKEDPSMMKHENEPPKDRERSPDAQA